MWLVARSPTFLSLVVALVFVSAGFWVLERWRPALPRQRRRARDTRTDLIYALLLHANVDWSYGRLRFVVASPTFHRWHHTSEEEGLDTNFAGLFPFIDLAFGTFYMPSGRRPERFGVTGEAVPDGLLAQLAYPFRRRGSTSSLSSAPADAPHAPTAPR